LRQKCAKIPKSLGLSSSFLSRTVPQPSTLISQLSPSPTPSILAQKFLPSNFSAHFCVVREGVEKSALPLGTPHDAPDVIGARVILHQAQREILAALSLGEEGLALVVSIRKGADYWGFGTADFQFQKT
jgi:hypothetical protein